MGRKGRQRGGSATERETVRMGREGKGEKLGEMWQVRKFLRNCGEQNFVEMFTGISHGIAVNNFANCSAQFRRNAGDWNREKHGANGRWNTQFLSLSSDTVRMGREGR
jgi:hypothetical protein